MNRYLPDRAAPVPTSPTSSAIVWAGLMFGSAALNIALALSLDPETWAAVMSAWGIASKIAPVPDPVRARCAGHRHAARLRDVERDPCAPS